MREIFYFLINESCKTQKDQEVIEMPEELSKEKLDNLYEIIEVAKATGKIKKGSNEATKAIERGVAKIVAYAKDANPPEVIMHIPLLCKEKGILCFSVPSKEELGASAGLGVSTTVVAVVEVGDGAKLMKEFSKSQKPAEKEAPAKEEKKEEPAEKEEEKEAPAKEEKKEEPAEKEEEKEAPAKEEKKEEPADEKKE
jgi:large subunit ribosomal protein L7Ae